MQFSAYLPYLERQDEKKNKLCVENKTINFWWRVYPKQESKKFAFLYTEREHFIFKMFRIIYRLMVLSYVVDFSVAECVVYLRHA